MKQRKPIKVTVTFTIYEEDLSRISQMRVMGDADPSDPDAIHLEDLLRFWEQLTVGNDDGEPDYEAYNDFAQKIDEIRAKMPALEVLARQAD